MMSARTGQLFFNGEPIGEAHDIETTMLPDETLRPGLSFGPVAYASTSMTLTLHLRGRKSRRLLRSLGFGLGPGASDEVLQRRVLFGGRKGRRAALRLRRWGR